MNLIQTIGIKGNLGVVNLVQFNPINRDLIKWRPLYCLSQTKYSVRHRNN